MAKRNSKKQNESISPQVEYEEVSFVVPGHGGKPETHCTRRPVGSVAALARIGMPVTNFWMGDPAVIVGMTAETCRVRWPDLTPREEELPWDAISVEHVRPDPIALAELQPQPDTGDIKPEDDAELPEPAPVRCVVMDVGRAELEPRPLKPSFFARHEYLMLPFTESVRVSFPPTMAHAEVAECLKHVADIVADAQVHADLVTKPRAVSAYWLTIAEQAAADAAKEKADWEALLAAMTPEQREADPLAWPPERLEAAGETVRKCATIWFLKLPAERRRAYLQSFQKGENSADAITFAKVAVEEFSKPRE